MSDDSLVFYQANQDEAWVDLSLEISRQRLCLMVGAGVSARLGLPEWPRLAVRVAEAVSDSLKLTGAERVAVNDIRSGAPTDTLLRRMLRARTMLKDDRRFDDIVSDCLYQDLSERKPNPGPTLMDASATLRALGLMVSGSMRGRINEVVSFNFDCILEWYLMQHGMVVASYRSWPSDYIDADVRIYHPHGYAPFPWSRLYGSKSEVLAFDEETVGKIAVDPANNWKHLYRYLFCTRKVFAVGLSGKDPIVNLVLQEAKAVRGESTIDDPPLGYWCQRIPQGTPDDEYSKDEWDDWKMSLNSRGIVLLEYSTHEQLGELLVSMVQNAAGGLRQGG